MLQGLPYDADRITGFKSMSDTSEILCNVLLQQWMDWGSFKKSQTLTASDANTNHFDCECVN